LEDDVCGVHSLSGASDIEPERFLELKKKFQEKLGFESLPRFIRYRIEFRFYIPGSGESGTEVNIKQIVLIK